MDFSLSEQQKARKQEFHNVCKELSRQKPKKYLAFESVASDDECWEYHLYCAKEFAKHGWLSLGWPRKYGGSGDMMDRVLFSEARGYYGVPGVDGFGVGMLAPTLLAVGNEDIKREFLPGIANAEVMWCELWSEPNAGSDLANLTTVAQRQGDEYIVNGQKTWNSAAHRADWAFGVYRTGPAKMKHKNLTFMLCDMRSKGITVRPLLYMNGYHIYNEVYMDNVHIPIKNVVGKENEGWAVVNLLAGFERSNIDMIMELVRALEDLVEYCNETRKYGKKLSEDILIRDRIAELAIEIEAARMLAYRVADMQNRQEMSLMDAAAVKVFASELGEKFAHLATDIIGPFGQVKTSRFAVLNGLFEYMYQSCFVSIISMGTNEIQRNIIAWYGLGLPRMK